MSTRDRRSPSSVRARLLDRAKREGTEFQRMLVLYANERLLHRLSRSVHALDFVLKGASMFTLWSGRIPRSTKDVDLLGVGDPSTARLESVFREILDTAVEPDGLSFDQSSVRAAPIRHEAIYDGVRVTLNARLGTAILSLQVDVGFGDCVDPPPQLALYPSLLDHEGSTLRVYPPEVSIAEKYHAMVSLGMTNSRMKDYFDVAFLASTREFDGLTLGQALAGTFARRQTMLPSVLPQGLQDEFARDVQKRAQWRAFVQRVEPALQQPLEAAVRTVREFLWPVTLQVRERGTTTGRWRDGGWVEGATRPEQG